MLVYAFKIPAIPVDVHVHRVSNRLGFVKTRSPENTEAKLKEIIPKNQWIRINRLFVKFGQQICVPTNSKCKICPVENICPKDFTMEEEARRKRKEAARRKGTREKNTL